VTNLARICDGHQREVGERNLVRSALAMEGVRRAGEYLNFDALRPDCVQNEFRSIREKCPMMWKHICVTAAVVLAVLWPC